MVVSKTKDFSTSFQSQPSFVHRPYSPGRRIWVGYSMQRGRKHEQLQCQRKANANFPNANYIHGLALGLTLGQGRGGGLTLD